MATVYSARVIEIAVVQSVGARPAVNVWHMQVSSELWPASAEAVVEDFRNNWQDHMTDFQAIAVKLVRFDWRSLDPNDSSVGVVAVDPAKSVEGQQAVPMAPPNVAALVHKNTAARPRGRRDGRSYIVGVPEGEIADDGGLNAPYVSSAQTSLTAFYNGISDSGVFTNDERWPVVLETTAASRAPGSQSVTISSRRLSGLTIDPTVATQRDRLR